MIPLCTLEEQQKTDEILEKHQPEFAGWTTGLLFPTGRTGCVLVDVPVRLGLECAMSPLDLDTTWWIAPGQRPSASSIDQEKLSLTVTRWPFDDSVPLRRPYTVFVAPQPQFGEMANQDTHPPNQCVERLVPGLEPHWRGNVLVVRGAPVGAGAGLNDMTEKDIYQAKAIVRRIIVEGLIGGDPAPYFTI
ncbi:hypothetical protein C8R43DRAFT_1121060 [Mycena crocata]|nr:hypothetical protein C8R43DRAFT_1121060 [Mycena crocata]